MSKRAILGLAANRSRLGEMRRRTRQLYEAEFHPDKVYGAMVKHIEHVQKSSDREESRCR